MPAFGYVRKSVMADDDRTLSPTVQEERIRALAASRGDDELVVLSDLGISGAKVEERPDYMRLVAAIESGEATAVYAYDLSRLHRNTAEALRFFKLAEERSVPVRLVAESIDTSGPTGELMLTILAAMNAWTSRVTSVKIKASLALKRANGEPVGGRPFGSRDGEDAQAVVEAFRAERSLFRAARRLNAAKVPTRNARSRGWSPSAVRAVVSRIEPDLLVETRVADRPVRGGRATKRQSRFGRVLRCSECGSYLTPSYDPRADAWRYYCHAYANVPHGRKAVTESAIIRAVAPAIEQTALRMTRLTRAADGGEVIDTDALVARRERYVEMYGEGLVTKERRDKVLREVEREMARAVSMRRVRRYTLPPDPATDTPERVNAWMRDTFERIVVDMATPGRRGVTTEVAVRPEWLDPAMHVSDGDAA
jgi:DNA invertase Pin-like site-specific DNA recombinase